MEKVFVSDEKRLEDYLEPDNFVNQLLSARDGVKAKYPEAKDFLVVNHVEYDSACIKLEYCRLETDKEYDKRQSNYRWRAERERLEFERLKKKFEGGK